METWVQFLTFLYGMVAVASAFAYIPQIYNLIISTGRSEAISITSWLLMLFTSSTALAYSLTVIRDLPLMLVNLINFLGVVMILSLTIYNRYFRFSEGLPKGVSTKVLERFHLIKTKSKNEANNPNS